MDIRQVQLATRSLDDTARFYERLGCPVEIVDAAVRSSWGRRSSCSANCPR
ncbi:hypothetical protein Q9Q99_05160 [Curtobacterium flaccumfaciens]|nr:hypothetical protein Q9Q99_05160 [Curtobacterium flaccumfaciens]